jgi:hypothetical protein
MKKFYSWYSVWGNPYFTPINPLMLLPDGYSVEKLLKTSKEAPKEVCSVYYDRSFVIHSIINSVIKPLDGVSRQQIEALITEALDFYFWAKDQTVPSYIGEKQQIFFLWEQYHDKLEPDEEIS